MDRLDDDEFYEESSGIWTWKPTVTLSTVKKNFISVIVKI